MIRVYLTGFVVAIFLSLVGVIYWQYSTIGKLKAKEVELTFAINSCSSRVENLIEDMKSDTKIDSTPDSGLSDLIDPSWLRRD